MGAQHALSPVVRGGHCEGGASKASPDEGVQQSHPQGSALARICPCAHLVQQHQGAAVRFPADGLEGTTQQSQTLSCARWAGDSIGSFRPEAPPGLATTAVSRPTALPSPWQAAVPTNWLCQLPQWHCFVLCAHLHAAPVPETNQAEPEQPGHPSAQCPQSCHAGAPNISEPSGPQPFSISRAHSAAQVMLEGGQADILLGAQARQLQPHCPCTAARCTAVMHCTSQNAAAGGCCARADSPAHLNAAQVATEGRQAG